MIKPLWKRVTNSLAPDDQLCGEFTDDGKLLSYKVIKADGDVLNVPLLPIDRETCYICPSMKDEIIRTLEVGK